MNDDQVEEVCEGLGCSFGQAVSLRPAANSCRSRTAASAAPLRKCVTRHKLHASMDLAAVGGA